MSKNSMKSFGTTLYLTEDKIILEHKRKYSELSGRVEIPINEIEKVIVKPHHYSSSFAYFLRNHEDEADFNERHALISDFGIVFITKKKYKEFLPFKDKIDQKMHELIDDRKQTISDTYVQELLNGVRESITYDTDHGTLIITKNTINLKHKHLYISNRGNKEISISSISSIHLSKPGVKAGRIRFFTNGSTQQTNYQSFLSSEDEILVAMPNQYQKMFEAKKIIEQLRLYHKDKLYHVIKDSTVSSPADEIRKYKSLLDDGIISKEEFEKKKQELLS